MVRMAPFHRFAALLALVFPLRAGATVNLEQTVVGERVDLARFATTFTGDNSIGVEWDNPREVSEIVVSGVDDSLLGSLHIEWWGSVWPGNGSGGWMRLDDPFNGRWVRVKAAVEKDSRRGLAFKFPPLTKEEWNQEPNPALKEPPAHRRTLKIRVVAEGRALPSGAVLSAYGQSRWREAEFDIESRHTTDAIVIRQIEVINGVLVGLESLTPPRAVKIEGRTWVAQREAGGSSGVRLRLRYADNPDLNSNDLTRVTVRFGGDAWSSGFSFVPQDVLADGAMRLPDFGTLVTPSSSGLTLANDPGSPTGNWRRSVRLRLAEKPEMTREMAMAGIPRLRPAPWVPLGVPSARQEFFVSATGDWSIWAMSLNANNGRDATRWSFQSDFGTQRLQERLDYLLDTREQPAFDGGDRQGCVRCLEQGHLPLIHVQWYTGPIRYHHSLATTILLGDYGDDATRKGDETVVLLSRLAVTNTDGQMRTATVNLRVSNNLPINLDADGLIRLQRPNDRPVPQGLTALRGVISNDKPAGGGIAGWTTLPADDPEVCLILRWRAELQPYQTRFIYFKTPFVELLEPQELDRIRQISYEVEVPAVMKYWQARIERGMTLDVPDSAVMDLYRANLWHNIITTDRDPETGLYNQNVGTVGYRVFANETVMIARSMDMRGEHVEAERFIEPMLRFQGHEPLKGRFSTKDGVFHSAGAYTHGEYAMNHGFVMWGIADHYLMTRDRRYLDRVAPQLIKGCDFLINERKSTMGKPGFPRTAMHGMAPACSLEDVVEYQYWFATNAYFHLGMKRVAQALADAGHPEAERIAVEAEEYRKDIERNIREAATRAATVRLRDGYFIPYVPSRVFHWRHLTEGWIREALYPAIHLATAEVVSPSDPLITWILDDLEDNIYFSWQSGFNIKDFEQTWFECGGVTLQPCLVDSTTAYMARNEIPAALRAFWNTYALSIFPDVNCFTEWAKALGKPGGPLYKTSDESRFIMWLRQLMIWEDGDRLWYGRAVPKQWLANHKDIRIERAPTVFGEAGLTIHSECDSGRIIATVQIPTRTSPREVWLRLRHPADLKPVEVFVNHRPLTPDNLMGQDIRLVPGVEDLSKPVEVVAVFR
ncbi:MAG: hypothetical protein ACUVXJ_17740 [Phycisphaerae bacterium]